MIKNMPVTDRIDMNNRISGSAPALKGKALRRKAQTEIFGLAIIVILLVLGMMLVLRATTGKQKKPHATFVEAHIAQDLLNALAWTRTSCPQLDMPSLVEECVIGGQTCPTPCPTLEHDLKYILQETLGTQRRLYRLRIYQGDPDNLIIPAIARDSSGEPIDEDEIGRRYLVLTQPGFAVLATRGGDISMVLEVLTDRGK